VVKIRAGGQEEPEREEILEPLEEPTPERRKEPVRETIPEREPERIPTRMGAAALPLGVVLIALSKVYKVTSKRELNRANLDRAMQSNLDSASKQRREALLRAATSLVAPPRLPPHLLHAAFERRQYQGGIRDAGARFHQRHVRQLMPDMQENVAKALVEPLR
jgi:hypothetical protein